MGQLPEPFPSSPRAAGMELLRHPSTIDWDATYVHSIEALTFFAVCDRRPKPPWRVVVLYGKIPYRQAGIMKRTIRQ
jgi:hypothetical protein